jgi:ABC-type sugar transport system ATPase subunit
VSATAAVEQLRKVFGETTALDNISFTLRAGEFLCIVGRTNAGKSTLLKTIAGLHRPDSGHVIISGRDVSALPPHKRRVSLLFQNIALFPTMTGHENIAFAMRAAQSSLDRANAQSRSCAR